MKKWYVSHPANARENAPVFFNALQTFASAQKQIQLILPPEANGELQSSQQLVTSADGILVEASAPSTGSGVELGWAHSVGKPIYVFHQGSTEPSPTLQLVATKIYVYVTETHILEALDQLL